MFVFSLLDCCALIFLSVYFVSLPEAGGGRPGALHPREQAGGGPGWGPGQVRGSKAGGRWPARVPWALARSAGPMWRARAGGGPRLPNFASHPGVRAGLSLEAHRPGLPAAARPCDARTRSALRGGWHLASPCGPQERGVAVFLLLGPGEMRVVVFLAAPLGRALRRMLGVPRTTAHVPGVVASGLSRAELGGGDLAPLVILWATPPLPSPLFSRVLELVATFHIQELTHSKTGEVFPSRCLFVGSVGKGLF